MVVCRSGRWAQSVIGLLLRGVRGAAVMMMMMFFLIFAAAVATKETFMVVVVEVSIG
jgi:hypothetical protein